MVDLSEFEDIRPYSDEEAVEALQRVSHHPALPMISKYLFPKESADSLAKMLRRIGSIDEFQTVVMAGALFLIRGQINVGDFTAYVLYVSTLLTSIRTIVNFTEQFENGLTGIERFCEIMDVQPDITFFLDISPQEGRKRNISAGKTDRMEQQEAEFHQKVYEGYKALSKIYNKRFIVVDASGSVEEVAEEIRRKFLEYKASGSE